MVGLDLPVLLEHLDLLAQLALQAQLDQAMAAAVELFQ